VRRMRLHRRAVLTGLAAAAAGSLRAHAAPRVPLGAAANHYILPQNTAYRAALAKHCDVIVAEGAMKWAEIRADRETFNFAAGDATVAFAQSHGLQVRGHTLVWCEGNPTWVQKLGTAGDAESELRRHIVRTIEHYRAPIDDWDVVNEPIAEKPRSVTDLRDGVWLARLGPRYIDKAFHIAADVAPRQRRVLNEYAIEAATPRDKLKREAFRRLILDLKDRGVPITGVGLQGHLDGSTEIDAEGVAAFCAEMTRAGLDVLVTELDVNDFSLPGNIAARDAIVAQRTEQFLSAVFAGCRPKLICTWGITDKHTWMPTWFKRRDGLINRPLPLDAEFGEKPMLRVLQRFSRGA
jgi:endo-1,4-beta-xylanase